MKTNKKVWFNFTAFFILLINLYSIQTKQGPAEYFIESEEGESKDFVEVVIEQNERFPDTLYIGGKDSNNKIALTFDDGPFPKNTKSILEILDEHNVNATFFLLGTQIEKYPELVKNIDKKGHLIGNHSYSHKDFRKINKTKLLKEINKTDKLIIKNSKQEPDLIRPPYGALTNSQIELLSEKGYKIIEWSLDIKDWRAENSCDIMMERANSYIHEGAIILLHDGGGDRSRTVKLLPKLITKLKEKGYEFTTVDKLINN
ncbi:MAG: polysaccharide deacetylase family protein [Candidatus Woesearchaeota archaeon]